MHYFSFLFLKMPITSAFYLCFLTDCWEGYDTYWINIFIKCKFKIGLVIFLSIFVIIFSRLGLQGWIGFGNKFSLSQRFHLFPLYSSLEINRVESRFFSTILFSITYFILPISNREAMGQIIDRGHGRIPVYEENPKNLIGLLLVCIFPYFDFISIISFLLGSFILTCLFYLFITRSKTF